MPVFDAGTLINWVVSGVIGLFFGVIGAYAAYRFERSRDNLEWEREKIKLEQQWKHDQEQMEIDWQHKLEELKIQSERNDLYRLRDDIRSGLDDPMNRIRAISRSTTILRMERMESDVNILRNLIDDGELSSIEEMELSIQILDKMKAMREKLQEGELSTHMQLDSGENSNQ